MSSKVEYLRGAISYILNQWSLLQQQEELDHLYSRAIGTHSIKEQQMGRYIGDVQTEIVLEEQSLMFMIS